ncbi:MAG: hypothetical protein JSR44_16615 [Spirochaetes bacterium]|nr:hypothetical protein [Spirochaetota bacterium]
MKSITTAENFWVEFSKFFSQSLKALKNWERKYEHRKTWTTALTEIFYAFGEKYGYRDRGEVASEYFRVDIIFSKWAPKQDDFAWDLDVAIEMENDTTQWYDEVVKLCHINCGLKVIMTYHNYSDTEELSKKIERCVELIKNRKYHSEANDWLLIFGPHSCADRKAFVAYKISDNKAKKLATKNIFPK